MALLEKTHQRIRSMIRHLYVHIPFCHRICPYCSFYKHEPGGTDIPAFLRALTAEAAAARAKWGAWLAPETVYFGGGTPSMVSSGQLEKWLPDFCAALELEHVREWTVEINPRTIDDRKAAVLRAQGVTRASLGVQAWDEPSLTVLGRDHAPAEAEEAYHVLRRADFSVVSIDLMFAVPGQTLDAWRYSLQRTLSLRPDHVSAYNLTYEEDTEFFARFSRGEYARDEAVDAAFFTEAMRLTEQAGYEHYEISNYAQPGCGSLHNSSYWAGADYLGLGPGAVSTVDRRRWKNVENTVLYMQQPAGAAFGEKDAETLTDTQWACERLALELRTARGVALQWLPEPARVEHLTSAGLAEVADGRLRLTREGKGVADSVIAHLWV
jgi:oxygen-independent coproporphyrinogen III oxidase